MSPTQPRAPLPVPARKPKMASDPAAVAQRARDCILQ